MRKTVFYLLSISIFIILFLFGFSNHSFAAYPKLVSTIISAFENIESWIMKIATPAAAVAVRNRYLYEKV